MGLKDLTNRKVGVALFYNELEQYPELVLKNFDSVTPEYEGAFSFVYKDLNPNWGPCDKIYKFCKENKLAFRMTPTTQVVHRFIPSWMDDPVDKLRDFIEEIVWRYEECVGFNLVNEFVSDNGLIIEQSYWYQTLGPRYYETILTWAKESNPNSKLYIEDHRIQYPRRWHKVYEVAKNLGELIEGVGIHGHHDLPSPIQLPNFNNQVEKFKNLGLDVSISEVSLSKGSLKISDPLFERFYAALINKFPEDCPITIWGMLERLRRGRQYGLFKTDGTPNAAYRGIEKGLKQAPKYS